MNCINHPEVQAVAYCQQCGKALCSQCVRTVSGIVLCEPCLAAKLGMPGAGAPAAGTYTVNIGDPNFQYSATGPLPARLIEFRCEASTGWNTGIHSRCGSDVQRPVHQGPRPRSGIRDPDYAHRRSRNVRPVYRRLGVLPGVRCLPDGESAA